MTDPRMANAAGPGAGGVVTAAATHSAFGHTMPLYSDTSMPTAQSIADALLAQPGSPFVLSQTESGDFVMGISRSITVTAGSMTFTNGVGLNKLVVVPPVTGTTSLSSGSTSFTYTPSFASSSCNSQTITVRGQSASGNITTSDRTIKVNVVDGFTLATGKATADSSSTPQVVNVSSFTTLLSPAFGSFTNVSITFGLGTITNVTETSFTYTAPVTGYAGPVTLSYKAKGLCGIEAAGTGTINLALNTGPVQAQSVTFDPPATAVVGGSLVPLATATSKLTVAFSIDPASTGVCTLSGGTVTFIAPGACIINADQAGNGLFSPALRVTRTIAINKATSTTTLTASNVAPLLGQPVTFTAAIGSTIAGPATGTVDFTDGTTVLCSGAAVSSNRATCTTSFATPGSHDIRAVYAGNAFLLGSTSAILAVVVGDQRKIMTQAIGHYLNQRNNQILSNEPSVSRQADRLMEAQAAAEEQAEKDNDGWTTDAAVYKLGLAAQAGDFNRFRAGGARPLTAPLARGGRDADDVSNDRSQPSALLKRDYEAVHLQGLYGNVPLNLGGPVTLNGAIGSRLSFSTSLREMTRFADSERDKPGAAPDAPPKFGPKPRPNPLDFWVEATISNFFNSKAISTDGQFGMISVGADYVFRPWFLAGVSAQFDSTRQSITTINGDIRGTGFMAGPYMTIRIADKLFWQARGAFGQSTNDVNSLFTKSDHFATKRLLASTTLSGRWVFGAWTFRPAATVSYMQDVAQSYVGLYAITIPEVSSRLGQAKAGPEWTVKIPVSPELMIEPRFGAQVIWNFDGAATSQGVLVADEASHVHGVRGRVEMGISAKTASGIIVDAAGSYDGIGISGYNAITAKGAVVVPLN
jgi:hypothetical protein